MTRWWYKIIEEMETRLEMTPDEAKNYAKHLYPKAKEEELGALVAYEWHCWQSEKDDLGQAHQFVFNKDTCLLLSLTDNDLDDRPMRLPYPKTFLDVDIVTDIKTNLEAVYEEHIIGVMVEECTVEQAEKQQEHPLPNRVKGDAKPEETIIQMVVYTLKPDGRIVDSRFPLNELAARYNSYRASRLPAGVLSGMRKAMPQNFVEGALPHPDFKMPKDRSFLILRNILANFLDYLEMPEVRFTVMVDDEDSEKRRPRDMSKHPPRTKVELMLPLRRYINEAKGEGQFTYTHSFWVRGYWMHFRHERYTNARGKKVWVMPYIRGRGPVVQKPYEVNKGLEVGP